MTYAVVILSLTTLYFMYLTGLYLQRYYYTLNALRQLYLETESMLWMESQQIIDILVDNKVNNQVVNIFKDRYRWMDRSNWKNHHVPEPTRKPPNVV